MSNLPVYLLLLCSFFSFGQENKKVVIVGNSISHVNEMTLLLTKMLSKQNDKVEIFEVLGPGMSLEHHWNILNGTGHKESARSRPHEVNNIKFEKEASWDFVILQEGGIPYLIPEYGKHKIYPALQAWSDNYSSSGTKMILHEPYAIPDQFPKTYCRLLLNVPESTNADGFCCSDTLYNLAQESQKLSLFTKNASGKLGFDVAPVGQVFQRIQNLYPEIKLFDDSFHPSVHGSYAIATVYYRMITGKDAPLLMEEDSDSSILVKINSASKYVINNL